jgi:hypothetical protein
MALPVNPAGIFQVALKSATLQVLIEYGLVQEGSVDIPAPFNTLQVGDELLVGQDPADPQPRKEDLRKAAGLDEIVPAAGQGGQGRNVGPGIP